MRRTWTSWLVSGASLTISGLYAHERIVLEGLRGEESIASLSRREGIAQNLYYRWSKDFLEAGKRRLSGDTKREANSSEVQKLKGENAQLKEALAELMLKNRMLKKNLSGDA